MNQVRKVPLSEVHSYTMSMHMMLVKKKENIGLQKLRSMIFKESAEDASVGNREADSLPEKNGGAFAADKAGSNKDEVPTRITRALTEKGKTFKLTMLKVRR